MSQKLKCPPPQPSSVYHPPHSEATTLTIYDHYPHSDSSLSSTDIKLEPSGQNIEEGVVVLQEPLLSNTTSTLKM